MTEHVPLPTSDPEPTNARSTSPKPQGAGFRFSEKGLKEATLVWKNIEKFVDLEDAKEGESKQKQLLFQVSGTAKPGELIGNQTVS